MVSREKGQRVRQRIIEAANRLFYERGYNRTSFSDIADVAGVQRGNFYYYFRSKEDILLAVIASRSEGIARMLADWRDTIADPRDRLRRYVQILDNEVDNVLAFGCPMGSLNAELGKQQPELQASAARMFDLFCDWLEQQFLLLGKADASRDLALELLGRTQGVALMSHVYKDAAFLRRQLRQLQQWIDSL